MSQYPVQEPQGQQPGERYSTPHDPYHSFDPQQLQPTYISQPPYPAQQTYQPYPHPTNASNTQAQGQPGNDQMLAKQLWHRSVLLLGKRGLLIVGGVALAVLSFFVLPYYSNYSGYFLAAETLDDKWWLELILAVLPLVVLVALQIMPRVKQQKRRWSLLLASSGALGILLHYLFLNGMIGSDYWRIGAWGYFIGMVLVAITGLFLLI
jgi:hypothetical protein